MGNSLCDKYRPKELTEIMGNDDLVQSLGSVLRSEVGRPHTFLFQGPSGCGKTTLARITARMLGGGVASIKEKNIAEFRGIDQARDLIRESRMLPLGAKCSIYVLNECHKATNEFQNAMLEILEEPPAYVYFILCTTDPGKLLATVRSRCAMFQVQLLSRPFMTKLLRWVITEEKLKFSDNLVREIIAIADGSPRKALIALDQIRNISDENLAIQSLVDSTIDDDSILDICRTLLLETSSVDKWKKLAPKLKAIVKDAEEARLAILGYMGTVMLNSPSDKVLGIIDVFSPNFRDSGRAGFVASCYLASRL